MQRSLNLIIDELPLDYSILEEIDYVYPANNAYFAYMIRGCVNNCKFCADPKLEPQYCNYINLKKRIEYTDRRFGARKDWVLLDNNVLASKCYERIIDDKEIVDKLKDDSEKTELYLRLEAAHCLYNYTASKDDILKLDTYVRPLYEKTHKPSKRKRIVDLCEESGASIYSFPMKYHPINDKDFFMNCNYIGKHWNRKFIRAVQAVLNSTKGKKGRGVNFLKKLLGEMSMNL